MGSNSNPKGLPDRTQQVPVLLTKTNPVPELQQSRLRLIPAAAVEFGDSWEPRPGTLLMHFRIGRKVGGGGMGSVFLAENLDLHRYEALKVIRPEYENWAELYLKHDARMTAKALHHGFVTVYGIHKVPPDQVFSGTQFMSMEYVNGNTLDDLLQGRRLSRTDKLEIFEKLLDAMAWAHKDDEKPSIIHRDLKPANIMVMLGPEISIKILDFGIAQDSRLESNPSGVSNWRPPPDAGTPEYMPPELFQDEQPTTAVDTWALGIILYEMLSTNRAHPFVDRRKVNTKEDIWDRLQAVTMTPLGAETRAMNEFLARALHQAPAQRFLNAVEMRASFQQTLGKVQAERLFLTSDVDPYEAAGVQRWIDAHPDVTLPRAHKNQVYRVNRPEELKKIFSRIAAGCLFGLLFFLVVRVLLPTYRSAGQYGQESRARLAHPLDELDFAMRAQVTLGFCRHVYNPPVLRRVLMHGCRQAAQRVGLQGAVCSGDLDTVMETGCQVLGEDGSRFDEVNVECRQMLNP